jgi:hypothetical protein
MDLAVKLTVQGGLFSVSMRIIIPKFGITSMRHKEGDDIDSFNPTPSNLIDPDTKSKGASASFFRARQAQMDMLVSLRQQKPVIPAKAGIHEPSGNHEKLDSCFRRTDGVMGLAGLWDWRGYGNDGVMGMTGLWE